MCFLFGRELVGVFTSDVEIINIAYNGLNFTNLGFFAVGMNLTTTVYYQSVEVPKYSNLLCIFRSVIFLPISVFVLGKIFGIDGIWLGFLVSELLSMISCAFIAYVPRYTLKYIAQ